MNLAEALEKALEKGPPKEDDFTSRWHDETVAARVGLALGICFSVCFLTGLLSHFVQHPGSWFSWPAHPIWLYRATQGVHVVTGIATIPLLLVKLWTIYPALFVNPPVRSLVHGLERLSVAVLVSSALFQLVTGVQNIAHWYPWGFSFPPAHYALAWVSIGSLLVHIAVKLPAIRRGLGAPLEPAVHSGDVVHADAVQAGDAGDEGDKHDVAGDAPSRRWLIGAAFTGATAAVLVTAGQTVPWLRRVSVLAPRSGHGPQGVPVNKTAIAAGVVKAANDPAWRLSLTGPTGTRTFALADLEAMPQHEVVLPIACVEGWSASATWRGVRVRDLAAAAGAAPDADLRFTSLQAGGGYRVSELPSRHVRAPESLVALQINGNRLDLDHGFPCRLIAPSRPGVLQTKWLSRIEVV